MLLVLGLVVTVHRVEVLRLTVLLQQMVERLVDGLVVLVKTRVVLVELIQTLTEVEMEELLLVEAVHIWREVLALEVIREQEVQAH